MNFKIKKIRKTKEPAKPKKEFKFPFTFKDQKICRKKAGISLSLGASIIVIILLFVGIAKAIGSIDLSVFLKVAGDDLQVDGYGHTNFLILGTGGREHDGGNLTDSIIVASLDNEQKLITMLSIPRDIYIEDPLIGSSRINEVYYKAKVHFDSSFDGIEHMKKKVETLMGIPIHYWVKLDFAGFTELIDALGGIDVFVENTISDPYYPKDGTYLYEPFYISAGQHHLDGKTALKYARSRKTTSDFDRAERQQQIIFAVKEKALSTELFFDTDRISNILKTLKENIETNITVKEIITLGSLAPDYSANQIAHRLIHDDPTYCGGFLYPPVRELYNGQFVLLPAGGYEFVHLYSDLNFNSPQIVGEDVQIQILNGTAKPGVAGEAKQILKRFCFDIVRYGNGRSKEIKETTYYYTGETPPESLLFLQKLIPGKVSKEIPQDYITENYQLGTDLILEIGSDYTDSDNYIDDPFNYIFQLVTTPSETTPDATTAPATTDAANQ